MTNYRELQILYIKHKVIAININELIFVFNQKRTIVSIFLTSYGCKIKIWFDEHLC